MIKDLHIYNIYVETEEQISNISTNLAGFSSCFLKPNSTLYHSMYIFNNQR